MRLSLMMVAVLGLSGCIVVPIPVATGPVAIGRTSAETLPDYDFIDGDGCRVVVNRDTGQEFRTCG
ncbi:hypothetical protein V8J82_03870 [Gymnodinialimonas sp. 2305UL16-5]|uniref:hypothetical protein n=1 Tax=Gymnodinialimonas mytili TaxID=3126503 RepID=UPI0030A4689A